MRGRRQQSQGDPLQAGGAEALGLDPEEETQRSVRIRSVDGMPFSYLTAHVPARIGKTFTKQELAARPLLALLERSGVAIERAWQRIGAVLATPGVLENAPVPRPGGGPAPASPT